MDTIERAPGVKTAADVSVGYAADPEYRPKGLVAPKYMGTVADQYDMSTMGRVQVLRVSLLCLGVLCLQILTLTISGTSDLYRSLVSHAR
jgi:hypothetical protein